MAGHNCDKCGLRARYDNNPRSWLGRIWRWHIKFCPGWKSYYGSLPEAEKERLAGQYRLKR